MLNIKKVAISVAVALSMFAFGGATQANASSITPSTYHFNSRTITYHINSSSKQWKNAWVRAIHKFDKNGTIKLKATSKKKAKITMTTVAKFKGKGATNAWDASWDTKKGTNILKHVSLRLSRKVCNEGIWISEKNTVYDGKVPNAIQAIAVGLGLDNANTTKGSLLNANEFHQNLSKSDKLGLAQAYANVK